MDPQLELTRDEMANMVNLLQDLRFKPDQALMCGLASSAIGKLMARIQVIEAAAKTPAPPPDTPAESDTGKDKTNDPGKTKTADA